MFKKVMAALLATVAFMPAAQAQEGEGQDGRDAGISRRGELQRIRERGGHQEMRADVTLADAPARFERAPDAQRPERQPDQPRPQSRPQPQPEPQARDDGYRGGEGRGTMFAERARRQQAEAQVQQQAQPPRQRDGDPARGIQRGEWQRGEWQRGDRPQSDPARSVPVVVDQRRTDDPRRPDRPDDNRRFDDRRRAEDARRADATRRNDGNRFGNQRWDTNRDWNDGNRTWNGSNNIGNGRTDWSRRWRDDNRYDWDRYRQQNRNLFRLPRYYAPYGWNYSYRRYSVGVTLSSLLWDQDYWIDDPAYYRLPPAYGPYRWVRYYNDALLVDIRSGYVVDTVYDIFW